MSSLYRNLVGSVVEYENNIFEINLKVKVKEKPTDLQLLLTKEEFIELREALNMLDVEESEQ